MGDTLKRILEPLDLLAQSISENDGTATAIQVRAVVSDCEQAIQQLDILLDQCQHHADGLPGPSNRSENAPVIQDDDSIRGRPSVCEDIDTLRTLLQLRLQRLSSLSRYGHFHTTT